MSRCIGSGIRLRRKMLRITEEELGDRRDIAYQKFQKYEKGTNKISAYRLKGIAETLGVPVSFFYQSSER